MIFVSLASLFFVNCKKEYTCICTYQGREVTRNTSKTTKKKAQEACERSQNDNSWALGPVVCELQ